MGRMPILPAKNPKEPFPDATFPKIPTYSHNFDSCFPGLVGDDHDQLGPLLVLPIDLTIHTQTKERPNPQHTQSQTPQTPENKPKHTQKITS